MPSLYRTRVKLPRWNVSVSVSGPCGPREGAQILRRLGGTRPRDWHDGRAARLRARAVRVREAYSAALDSAALETFGRPFAFGDYRISGIGREEFREDRKRELRRLAQSLGPIQSAAAAHDWAGRYLSRGAQ